MQMKGGVAKNSRMYHYHRADMLRPTCSHRITGVRVFLERI